MVKKWAPPGNPGRSRICYRPLAGGRCCGYDDPMRGFPLRVIAVLTLALVAGCSAMTTPPRPAMVALETNGDYGYSETQLADDQFQVRYAEPRLQVSTNVTDRQTAIEASKQRSYDLALWRAADLAATKGFVALQVVQDRRDADVDVTDRRRYRRLSPFIGYGYYGYPTRGYRPWLPYHYEEYPYFPYYPYEDDYFDRQAASARVTVTLTVKFLRDATAGAMDAATTAAALKQRYATATFPPPR